MTTTPEIKRSPTQNDTKATLASIDRVGVDWRPTRCGTWR